jgi:hypothetical protein
MKRKRLAAFSVRARRVVLAAAFASLASLASSFFATECWALTKDECLEAHGRGQDQRDGGRLTLARQTFLTCAQSVCPPLVQADCARFGEELDRIVPTVSFAARDTTGGDLPDAIVYVDDQPAALRLDDGKSYDLDPGKHTIRFVYQGHEAKVSVVLSQGEKGRNVIATFADIAGAPRSAHEARALAPEPRRPVMPLVVVGLGAATAITGGVLLAVGLKEVPSQCSIGTRQCVAPPGDPSLAQAHSGVTLANVGVGVGIGGAALLVGGTIWYFTQPAKMPKETSRAPSIAPWFGTRSGGLSLSSRF